MFLVVVIVLILGPSVKNTLSAPVDDYGKVLSAIEESASRHAATADFGNAGATEEVVRRVLEDAAPDSTVGIYSKRHTSTMLVFDRYAVDSSNCTYKLVKGKHDNGKVSSVSLAYYLDESQVAEAEAKVRKVAAAARKKGGQLARAKYIHDWIVLNSAYSDVASTKWNLMPAYKLSSDLLNTCSGSQILAHRGMCHTYTLSYLRICKAAGVRNMRYVGCITGTGPAVDHAVAAAKRDGKWIYTDVTWDDPVYGDISAPGFEVDAEKANTVGHDYFMRSKSYMVSHDHKL